MCKKLKPGQLHTINNQVYRVKKRECGCYGCAFNNVMLCPNILLNKRLNVGPIEKFSCAESGTIFTKVQFVFIIKTSCGEAMPEHSAPCTPLILQNLAISGNLKPANNSLVYI